MSVIVVCVCGWYNLWQYVFVYMEAIFKQLIVESQQSVPLNLESVTQDLHL